MEIYCNLLLIKCVMYQPKIINSHECNRINKALSIKEALETVVLGVFLNIQLLFKHVKVALSIPKLICII